MLPPLRPQTERSFKELKTSLKLNATSQVNHSTSMEIAEETLKLVISREERSNATFRLVHNHQPHLLFHSHLPLVVLFWQPPVSALQFLNWNKNKSSMITNALPPPSPARKSAVLRLQLPSVVDAANAQFALKVTSATETSNQQTSTVVLPKPRKLARRPLPPLLPLSLVFRLLSHASQSPPAEQIKRY